MVVDTDQTVSHHHIKKKHWKSIGEAVGVRGVGDYNLRDSTKGIRNRISLAKILVGQSNERLQEAQTDLGKHPLL